MKICRNYYFFLKLLVNHSILIIAYSIIDMPKNNSIGLQRRGRPPMTSTLLSQFLSIMATGEPFQKAPALPKYVYLR